VVRRFWAAYEAILEVRDTASGIQRGLQWLEPTHPSNAQPKSGRKKVFAILQSFLGCVLVVSLVLVVCLFLFVRFFAPDTPEGLAREKLDAWIEKINAKGDAAKAEAAEAKLSSINERANKLSPKDKKKFDAADEVKRRLDESMDRAVKGLKLKKDVP
jgi:hypothetical protein